MIGITFALATVIGALAVEWAARVSGVTGISSLPFGNLFILWWAWRMPYMRRVVFAGVAGFLRDAIGVHPFGTFLILFLLLAGAAELLHAFFSAQESPVARGIGGVILAALFFLMMPLVAKLMGILV